MQGQRYRGPGAWPLHFFAEQKEKKEPKRKKERVSREKVSKGSHQGVNVTVLAILERYNSKTFFCRPTMVADTTFQYREWRQIP